jgi:hypothetical protein
MERRHNPKKKTRDDATHSATTKILWADKNG